MVIVDLDKPVCEGQRNLYYPANKLNGTIKSMHWCRYPAGHEGNHKCQFCRYEWENPSPKQGETP